MVSKNILIGCKLFIIVLTSMVMWNICEAGLRVLGGRDALKDEFPFAVRLEYQFSETEDGKTRFTYFRFCTGSSISPNWILTAAHGVDDDYAKIVNYEHTIETKRQKFARYNSHFPKELGQLSLITEVLVYPGYAMFGGNNGISRSKYDIALFKTENVKISQYAKLSAIDYMSFIGHEAFLLGFGLNNATPMEKPLQVLESILIKCDKNLGRDMKGMLCVAPRCGQEATGCAGDSGGPVVHASGVVGVVTGGYSCNWSGRNILYIPGLTSGIISMISPAIDWISNVLANETAA